MAHPHQPAAGDPHGSTADPAWQIARVAAALQPKSVAVIGDDPRLIAALLSAGLSVVPADQTIPFSADLAVVHCGRASALQLQPVLREGVSRVLLVAEGDSIADWVTIAADRGFFRSAEQPDDFATGAVLLEASEPTPAELVARYERLAAEVPALQARVRELRHQMLTAQDHAIGTDGELMQLRLKNAESEALIAELYESTTWRVGTKVVSRAARVKRALGR